MNVVWRLVSVGALVLSAGVLLYSVVSARREQRVRPGLDLARLAATVVTTVLMARLLGVTTAEALMGAGLLGGLLVGLYEGLHLHVRFLGKQAFARRTVLGVAAWGAGVVVVQTAGVIGRIGLADFGLTVSFFGIGQVVGLLTGRWQSVVEARHARAGSLAGVALVALALAAGFLPDWAAWAQPTEPQTEDLGGGDVQVTLRWSSLADLDLSVTDPAGDTVSFDNPTIASGGQLDRDANYPCSTATTTPVENVFWPPGEAARGSYRVAVTYRTGCGTEPAESYELTVLFGDEVARQVDGSIDPGQVIAIDLVYEGQGQRTGSGELSAAEGTSAALVGLGGTALLLGTALMESGNSAASLMGAWKGGGLRGLRDLAANGPGGSTGGFAWRDPGADLGRGRAAAALDRLPPDLRATAREVVLARLDAEETDRLAEVVRGAMRPGEPGADPVAHLASDEKAAGLLAHLPREVRERVEARVLGGLREERLQGAVEAAVGGDGLGPGVEIDADVDLPAAVHRSGRVGSALAGLPEEMRAEAEGRLVERLQGERLGRWVEKLRGVAAPAVGRPGGSVLDGGEAQELLAGLPPGLRERVQAQASRLLENELVEELVGRAKRAIERSRAVELLGEAFGRGDGDAADAVVKAAAAVDAGGEADLEGLVRRATGGGMEGVRSLARSGGVVPPADLTGHLTGEPDLLAAVRRVEGVEAVLTGAGPGLRPQVSQALVQALDKARIDLVVDRAAQALGPAGTAAADVMSAVRDVPGTKGFFESLAEAARGQAYQLLGERLGAKRVEEVGRAVTLDRAEESLRAAARAGDIDAADRILGSLSSEEARAVSIAALGEA